MRRATNFILIDHMPVALDCSTEEGLKGWVQWMEENRSQRIVADEKIGPYWISTVFLGLLHRSPQGAPVLFETMIFEQDESTCLLIGDAVELIDHAKSELHHLRWRYPTWEAAEQGHRCVAGMVTRSLRKDREWWESVEQIVKNKSICR